MRSIASVDVILVGFTGHPDAKRLVDKLRSYGLDIAEAGDPSEVPKLLRGFRRAAVAVYSPKQTGAAERVLDALDSAARSVPVVVVVDETDFGEYYALMSAGANEYFGLSESPEVIVRGVAWAAHSMSG